MSKVIILSRTFPKGHLRQGEPTYFVEGVWNSFRHKDFGLPATLSGAVSDYTKLLSSQEYLLALHHRGIKYHTICSGKRFKTGDIVSLRVWSGKPYRSKQIAIAPDVEVTVYDFMQTMSGDFIIDRPRRKVPLETIAANDGLSLEDLRAWIYPGTSPMRGQIICWNPAITY